MAFQWSRCIALVAAGVAALSLAACGSSTVESALQPSRIISFGDANSDIGQSGSRFTVSGADGVLNWTEQIASDYGLSIQAAANGGLSFAEGNSRVVLTPDAAEDGSTPTLAAQIDSFLAANQFGSNDLVLVGTGTSDLIVQAQAALAGSISRDEAYAAARQAGEDLTTQVQRLLSANAKHVVIIGVYDLGESIWARNIGEQVFLEALSKRFNEGFKISMQEKGYGNEALYVDFEYYINNVTSSWGYFSISDMNNPVCNSVDSGNGIGIGTGQVSSALCSTSTLIGDVDIDDYGFADAVYLTPTLHRQFGRWAYDRIRDRW